MPARPSAPELLVGLPLAALVGAIAGTLGAFKHQSGVSAATGAGTDEVVVGRGPEPAELPLARGRLDRGEGDAHGRAVRASSR